MKPRNYFGTLARDVNREGHRRVLKACPNIPRLWRCWAFWVSCCVWASCPAYGSPRGSTTLPKPRLRRRLRRRRTAERRQSVKRRRVTKGHSKLLRAETPKRGLERIGLVDLGSGGDQRHVDRVDPRP